MTHVELLLDHPITAMTSIISVAQLDCLIESLKYVIEIDPEEFGKITDGRNEDVYNDIHFAKRSAKATENIKKAVAHHRIILRSVNVVKNRIITIILPKFFKRKSHRKKKKLLTLLSHFRYVNDVQDYFNISICVQYFVSGVVICCSGILVVVGNHF